MPCRRRQGPRAEPDNFSAGATPQPGTPPPSKNFSGLVPPADLDPSPSPRRMAFRPSRPAPRWPGIEKGDVEMGQLHDTTFEAILERAKAVRAASGTDDLSPTLLVERLGELIAIVTLELEREHALALIPHVGVGFGATALTAVMDTFVTDTGQTRQAVQDGTYRRGDMARAVESGHGEGISSALAVTRAKRIDGDALVTFALARYHHKGTRLIWAEPI